MDAIIGIFSDVPAGTVIFLVVLAGLMIKFSGPNLFKDKGGGSGKSGTNTESSGTNNHTL